MSANVLSKNDYKLMRETKERVWSHINKKRFFDKPSIHSYLNKLRTIRTSNQPLNNTIQKYIRELTSIEQEIDGYEDTERQSQSNDVSINLTLELSQDINEVNNLQVSKNILNGNRNAMIPLSNEFPHDSFSNISSLLTNVDFQYSNPALINHNTSLESNYIIYPDAGEINKILEHSDMIKATQEDEALVINDKKCSQVNKLNYTDYLNDSESFLCNTIETNAFALDTQTMETSAIVNSLVSEAVTAVSFDSGNSTYNSDVSYVTFPTEDFRPSKKRKLSHVVNATESTFSDFVQPLPLRNKKINNESDMTNTLFDEFDDRLFQDPEVAAECLKRMNSMLEEFKTFCIKEIDKNIEDKKETTKNIAKSPARINPFFFDPEIDQIPPSQEKEWENQTVNLEHLAFVYEKMYEDLLNNQLNVVVKKEDVSF